MPLDKGSLFWRKVLFLKNPLTLTFFATIWLAIGFGIINRWSAPAAFPEAILITAVSAALFGYGLAKFRNDMDLINTWFDFKTEWSSDPDYPELPVNRDQFVDASKQLFGKLVLLGTEYHRTGNEKFKKQFFCYYNMLQQLTKKHGLCEKVFFTSKPDLLLQMILTSKDCPVRIEEFFEIFRQ